MRKAEGMFCCIFRRFRQVRLNCFSLCNEGDTPMKSPEIQVRGRIFPEDARLKEHFLPRFIFGVKITFPVPRRLVVIVFPVH